MKAKSTTNRLIALIVYLAVLIASMLITPPAGLSVEGFRAMAILLAAVILWITDAIPASMTCFLIIAELMLMGVSSSKDVYAAAGNASLYFIFLGFALSAALMNTNLPNHILRAILKITGNNSAKIIAGITILTSIISLIVTNSAAIVCTVGVGVAIIKAMGDPEPGKSNMAKALMIGIVWGSCVGGLAMPCSNSLNVTICDLLEQYTGVSISFLEWMVAGVPIYLISLIFVCWWLPKIFKPEQMSDEQYNQFVKYLDSVPKQFNAKDKKFIVIFLLMLVFWIAGNWIKMFNVVVVGAVGVALMFAPGIDLVNAKQFLGSVKPGAVIFIAAVMPLAGAMKTSGAGQWVVDTLFAGAGGLSSTVVLLMISAVAMVLGAVLPSGVSTASICCSVMSGVAFTSGVSIHAMAVIIGIWGSISYLFAFHGLYQFTFTYGYYEIKDTLKAGVVMTAFLFVVGCVVAPALYALTKMP